jgi:sugar/nucleoside kinase (ribokinase family)
MTVVVIGDTNVDLEIRLPSGPRPTHANPDPTMTGGGSAANTAAALAKLGVSCRFVGTVGDDPAGRFAIESLAESRVDVTSVRTVPVEPTVMVLVVVPPDGDRLIYVWPPRGGAHGMLEAQPASQSLEGAEWLHISGICLRVTPARDALLAAMAQARSKGIPISLDLNLRLENWGWEHNFRETAMEAINRADIVLGSAHDEIDALVDAGDPVASAQALAGTERTVVARNGADGAIAIAGEDVVRSAGFDIDVVDTVGAGDAFDAGFIAARLANRTLSESLTWGNAVAGLTVSRPGARSTPTRTELDRLLAG